MKTIDRIHNFILAGALIPALLCMNAFAQVPMKESWSTKLDHEVLHYGLSYAGDYCYGSNDIEFSSVRTIDGEILWNKRFNDIATGFSNIDEQIPMWEANVLFMFDRKDGNNDITACIDLITGEFLWSTRKYQNVTGESIIYIPEMEAFAVSNREGVAMVRARTGEEIWNTRKFIGVVGAYVYMPDGHLVMLNYKPADFESIYSGIKNQIVRINVNNGDVVWDETYTGRVEMKIITREPLAHLEIANGKVLLYLDGIQVYDYETGAKSWTAAYDTDMRVVKAPKNSKRFHCYGVIAKPIVSGSDVYVIDMRQKSKQFIKKYDLDSGRLLWTSTEIPTATAIPGMYLVGNTIVLQIGGAIECQSHEYETKYDKKQDNKDTQSTSSRINERWQVFTRSVKPCGLMAYNSDNGSLIWQSERFKKGITNAFCSENHIIVCSGTALYLIEIATGMELYEVKLKNDGIGLVQNIIDYKDRILVVGEKGVSNHNKSDGRLMASGRWKTSEYMGMYGDTLLFQKGNVEVAAFDAETCGYQYYRPLKGCASLLSDDGKSIFAWEKNTISKMTAR